MLNSRGSSILLLRAVGIMINTRLGAWIIDELVAEGGTASLYRVHREDGTLTSVAVAKLLHANQAHQEAARAGMAREAAVLRQLDHPHIVLLLEEAEHEGRPYLILEAMEGDLGTRYLHNPLPAPEALEIAIQATQALKHAHDRGVIHGSLKPGHLLYRATTTGMSVKLTDFSQAWVFALGTPPPSDQPLPNPGFLAPEQIAGKPLSRRCDLFSLGATLYTLITGQSFASLVNGLGPDRYARVPPVRQLAPDLPEEIEAVLRECLAVDPAHRPADAGVLLRRLESVRRRLGWKASVALPPEDQPPLPLRSESSATEDLLSAEQRAAHAGGPLRRFFHHPLVLATLLLITLGLIVWGFLPPSADSLYERGAALMESEDPNDWRTAWDDYFSRLEERYPDHPYKEKVAIYRQRVEDLRMQDRAAVRAQQSRPPSEAQWFYIQGMRWRQLGEEARAQKCWHDLITAFEGSPSEHPWVQLARETMANPASQKLTDDQRWVAVRRALVHVRQLVKEGRQSEARKTVDALKDLYHNDPTAADLLRQADKELQP